MRGLCTIIIGEEKRGRALMGNQMPFRKDKWTLTRVDGRYEFCDNRCVGVMARSLQGQESIFPYSPREGDL